MEEDEATGTSVITDLELQSPRRGRKLSGQGCREGVRVRVIMDSRGKLDPFQDGEKEGCEGSRWNNPD